MDEQIGHAWGDSLGENKTLLHLDLSNNDLSEASCRLIGQGLERNQTLYGVHMQGNACYVNCFGHLRFEEDIVKTAVKKFVSYTPKSTLKIKQVIQPMTNTTQKEILFQRMEGTQAVVKKKIGAFTMGNNSPVRSPSIHSPRK